MSSSDDNNSSDILLLVRQLTAGLRRRHKKAHLLRVWHQAQLDNNVVVSAAIYAYLGPEQDPQAPPRVPFNFNSLSNEQCIDKFRFDKNQIGELVLRFGLDGIRTRERTTASGVEGLCIVLYKLAVPIRWVDLEDFFGRNSSGLSNIFLHVLTYIDAKFAQLQYFNHAYVVQNLQAYADAVFEGGGLLQNFWAFMDGTVRGICRPRPRNINRDGKFLSQKSVYNGHKRKHALKYQTLTTPDGLIAHLYGPFPGRNHDIKVFKDSQLSATLRSDPRFRPYRIYGDQAYENDDILCSPYAGAVGNLSQEQRQVNVSMSRVRVSVEWSYGQITNYWTALDFKRQARVGLQPVGLMYRVGVLLTNCITCAQGGNTISDFFGLPPPSLQTYLQF